MGTKRVGGIAVDLIARTAKWVDGFKRAKRHQSSFERGIQASARRIATYAAGYLAVRRLVTAFHDQRKAIDSVAKTSDKLGIATQHLIQLQYAASLSGVETRKLNMALQRMTRRVAEAATGTGEARDALALLRLDARELGKLAPDKLFLRFAEAMQHVESQGQRVRIAFKLFDSEGVDVINMLNRGAAGLQAMYAEADQLGLSLSRVEAAQVEAANDELRKAAAVMEGVARQAIVQIAPYITAAAKAFRQWAMSGGNAGERVLQVLEAISIAVAYLQNAVDLLKVPIYALGGAGAKIGQVFGLAFYGIVTAVDTVGESFGKLGAHWLRIKAVVLQGMYDITRVVYEQTAGAVGERALGVLGRAANKVKNEIAALNETASDPSGIAGYADRVKATADKLGEDSAMMFSVMGEHVERVYGNDNVTKIQTFFETIRDEAQATATAQIHDVEAVTAAHAHAAKVQLGTTEKQKKKEVTLWRTFSGEVFGLMGDIVDNARIGARQQFEITKALRAAECVVDTAGAIMKYHAMTPPRPGMAIAVGILGAAKLAAILGTTYEGGGASVGSAGAVPATEDNYQVESARGSPTVNLVLQGSGRYTKDDVIGMFEAMNEALGDGYHLNVSGG